MPPENKHIFSLIGKLFTTIAIVGALIVLAGIAMVAIGGAADTDLSFFGTEVSTKNVGVVALVVGGTMMIVCLGKILSTLNRTIK